jgi:hypothetical protein
LPSIGDARKKLPGDFVNELYETYSPGVADKILSGMIVDRYTTLRVNTIKYDIQSLMAFLREKNIKFERVPWYNDALIIKNAREREIEKFDIYEKGFLSFQSLSSMVPPVALNPREGEKILDLTAAPGSKTTQMAAMMNNKGYILANELDKIRSERLKHKVNIMGADIVEVVTGRGEKLGSEYLFRPDTPVTRGEFLAMCLAMNDTETLRGITRTGFSDDESIPMWVKPYVSTALMSGIITGFKNNDGQLVFASQAPITFSEAAVILNNSLKITDVISVGAFSEDACPVCHSRRRSIWQPARS